MTVQLLHNTPLWVCSKAIRKCWASEDKSDTYDIMSCPDCGKTGIYMDDISWYCDNDVCSCQCYEEGVEIGNKDKELIHRVGNKNKHSSTLEHLNYTFDIDGISRACLQELARHRHTSLSVKSTRYTLKELKEADIEKSWKEYLVPVSNTEVNKYNIYKLIEIQKVLRGASSNDIVKYMLPEAYKTSLVWTINARSLQNFLELRTSKAALWEIRKLAQEIYSNLPEEHKYLFEEFVNA